MRVLITGTTSGLGKAFAFYYLKQGHEVIAVNRRESPDVQGQMSHVLDIADPNAVNGLFDLLADSQTLPDLFILNAGVNRPDNLDSFDFQTYDGVMRTNLAGVLSFVSAIQGHRLKGKKIVCLSSTSNIVPNPGHVGYYISKLALREVFKLLQKRDTKNDYKTIVLGPVHTNIMAGYAGPQGLQGKIFEFLAVSSETAAGACAEFIASSKKVFYFTKPACLFYGFVRLVLKFLPGLYVGSLPSPAHSNT